MKNLKVPILRFDNSNEPWKKYKLGSLITEIETGTNELGKENKTNFPLLKMGNIQLGTFSLSKLEYLTREQFYNSQNYIVKKGDFLFNTRNTLALVGKAATWMLENKNFIFNSNIARISFDTSKINTYFLNYLYTTPYIWSQVKARAVGTTSVAAVYPRDLATIKLFIPSIKEQEKISDFLKLLDSKIQLQQEKIDLLKEQKKGYMQKIFSQEWRFKDENGQVYPEWSKTYIGNCFDNYGGTALEKHLTPDGAYKFISIGSYSENGKYNDQNLRVNLNDKTKGKLLNKDDLVMVLNDKTSAGNIIGRVLLIENNNEYIYNQRSERLVCKENILPKYAWHFLNSDYFRKNIISMAQGGTQIYVNFSNVSKIELKLPSLNEQYKILSFLNKLQSKIDHEEEKLKLLQLKKQAFMQQMFI